MGYLNAIDHETHEGSRGVGLKMTRPRRAAPADAARVTRAEVNLAHARHNLLELRACLASSTSAPAAHPACSTDAPAARLASSADAPAARLASSTDGSADAAAARGPLTIARPAPPRIWAVLKADGYGHGASQLAVTLEQAGVDGVCVALLEEGLELRGAGVRVPILVMSGAHGRRRDGLEALILNDLTPVIYAPDQLEGLANAHRYLASLASKGMRAPVADRLAIHVKVDTGMGRLGVCDSELDALLSSLRTTPELRLDGLMTHLACADAESDAITREQLRRFGAAAEVVARHGQRIAVRHAANSAAMLRWPTTHLDVVRPGLALFGVHPSASRTGDIERTPRLKPVMRVLTEIVALRDLPVGASIGYGHDWTAARPTRVATIPMGYADGLSRALSNRGSVLIGGVRAPIVGTVSMDLTMVDVTDIAGVTLRDEVVVLGEQRGRLGSDCITAVELAEQSGTISWECLTSISRRVPRFYRHS